MSESTNDLQTRLMKLIDEYAELHATCGSYLYNEASAKKRNQLLFIMGELAKSPERSILTFIKGSLLQMEKEVERNEQFLLRSL